MVASTRDAVLAVENDADMSLETVLFDDPITSMQIFEGRTVEPTDDSGGCRAGASPSLFCVLALAAFCRRRKRAVIEA